MLEVYAFDTLTGQRLTSLPIEGASWSVKVNGDESISATIDARTREAKRLRVWEACLPVRASLVAMVGGEPVAAGLIWKRTFDGRMMGVTAGGIRSYLSRRLALPVAARTTPLVLPNGDPNAMLDSVILSGQNLSLGTIGKRYVQMIAAWPSGNLPILLPEDVPSAPGNERTVLAVDLKSVRTLIDNLSGVENGPDFEWRAARNGEGIQWIMSHGTPSQPRLGSDDPTLRKFALESVEGIAIADDATGQASESFGTGGGQSDRVIAARGFDPTLVGQGFPLLQIANKGRNDVTKQSTMQSYVNQDVALGKYLTSAWSIDIKAGQRGTPTLATDYWIGDLATVTARPGYPIYPEGTSVVRRIAAISGDADDSTYKVTFAEAVA